MAGLDGLGVAAVMGGVATRLRARPHRGPGPATDEGGFAATILDRISELVLLLDADGVVVFANAAARARELRPGDNVLRSELVHVEERGAVRAAWERLLELPGQSVSVSVRIRRGAGWGAATVTGENLLQHAAVGAILVTATDALRHQERDVRLQQAQRLEAIGRLAGGIAHDFNNHLTTIQGLGALALDDPELSAGTRSDLTEVVRAAENAATVTRRLLAFSRRQLLRPQQVDVNEQVSAARKPIARMIGDDVVVSVTTGARNPTAFVDPAQLEQILLNLALNARDAMPEGGTLTLRTADLLVREEGDGHSFDVRAGDYLLLEVSDDGPGIPVALRQQVFEPFFTTKTAQHGSGLGLSTVYGIVKQSGGYVWIGDADGGGARVSILLPRSGAPVAPHDGPSVEPEAQRGGTVLIAEDDAAVRFLARRVLSGAGYTVLEAANGDQALEIASAYTGRIDLLLSDVMMPGVGGREIAERCRVARPETAVLFMSGYQDDAVLRRGIGAGAAELLEKPFRPEALVRRVRERIAAHRLPT